MARNISLQWHCFDSLICSCSNPVSILVWLSASTKRVGLGRCPVGNQVCVGGLDVAAVLPCPHSDGDIRRHGPVSSISLPMFSNACTANRSDHQMSSGHHRTVDMEGRSLPLTSRAHLLVIHVSFSVHVGAPMWQNHHMGWAV